LGRRAFGDRLCLTFTAAAWRSPDAKAQIDYEIDSQQEAWHLPGDGHGLRRPAAAPCEPEDVVWADSVASLFTPAARRAATSPSVKKHAVIARTALCTPVAVLYSTLGRAINSEQANAAAAGGRNCFFHSHGFDLSIKYRARSLLALLPSSRYIFRLRQILKDRWELQHAPNHRA
jgi:hypothetical protein